MILFIHVPKTAGTSCRLALQKAYGRRRIAMDYGADSPMTSRLVRSWLYPPSDDRPSGALPDALRARKYRVLAGHFAYSKYGQGFDAGDIVCFIREPLHRLASLYLHKVRLDGHEGSFESFVELPAMQNIQTRLLSGLPAEAFVGITERYRDSLQLLEQRLGCPLPVARHNTAPPGGAAHLLGSLPSQLLSRIRALNAPDIDFYRGHSERFERLAQRQVRRLS